MEKFGRLSVKYVIDRYVDNPIAVCECECGKKVDVLFYNLKRGHTKSCGCLCKEKISEINTKHGHTKNRNKIYNSWVGMKQRCTNKNATSYEYYGARGIKVCERWVNSFENFLNDMGERPEGMSLDRINNDGDYCPENCRWATSKEQSKNKRKNIGALGISGIRIENEKYRVRIKGKHVGVFRTIDEAIDAKQKYMECVS